MRDATIIVYSLCVAAAAILVFGSRRPGWRIGTVTQLLDVVLAERAPRIVLVLFWWWIGWHFLVGQTVDPPVLG